MKFIPARYVTALLLMLITSIFYGGRSILSISGREVAQSFNLTTIQMGYLFSVFSASYVIFQIPCGLLLDTFKTKTLYLFFLISWSLVTVLTFFITWLPSYTWMFFAILLSRFVAGIFEAPLFPANSRIVSMWFPSSEISMASAIFGSAQYLAIFIFSPLIAFVTFHQSWQYTFLYSGIMTLCFALVAHFWLQPLDSHPYVSKQERNYINKNVVTQKLIISDSIPLSRRLSILLTNRSMIGLCIGQYCMNAITFFFITWFPLYLMKTNQLDIINAGLLASIPALFGFIGNLIGGYTSDKLLKNGYSTSVARKLPIIIGMSFSSLMVTVMFFSSEYMIILIMSIAFFGKGLSSMGWTIVTDIAPSSLYSLCGSIFNTSGNLAGIMTPISIAYLIEITGNFDLAIGFISLHAVIAIFCFSWLVGDLRKIPIIDIKKQIDLIN